MLAKLLISAEILAIFGIILLFAKTTPASAGALGLLAFFVFSYMVALPIFTFTLRYASVFYDKVRYRSKGENAREAHSGITLKKSYYFASVLAMIPVLLVSLNSVSRVGIYEIILIAIFVFIGLLYVAKRSS